MALIPNYATITTPLHLLMQQDTPWKWEQEEQRALSELKEALVGDQVMSFFDPIKKEDRNHWQCQSIWSWWSSDTRG